MRALESTQLEKRGVELLDPRSSYLQLRCRGCGATWRPRRSVERGLEPGFWRCWRGCNAEDEEAKAER